MASVIYDVIKSFFRPVPWRSGISTSSGIFRSSRKVSMMSGNSRPNFSVRSTMPTVLSARTFSRASRSSSRSWTTTPSTPARRMPVYVSTLSLMRYIFMIKPLSICCTLVCKHPVQPSCEFPPCGLVLQVTQNHEGDDQSVEADTFCQTYEDEGFTEYAGVFADRAEGCACRACHGDTAADTGESCNEGCRQVAESCCESAVSGYGFCSLYVRAGQHHDACDGKCAEEEECVGPDGAFVALL